MVFQYLVPHSRIFSQTCFGVLQVEGSKVVVGSIEFDGDPVVRPLVLPDTLLDLLKINVAPSKAGE